MSDERLTHLKQLEAESIHIIREVAAEFDNPVMLYSIGKDSAVMLHLAMKAFYPAKLPFPLMHVNTGWKFKDMITFRDEMVKKNGLELISKEKVDLSAFLCIISSISDAVYPDMTPSCIMAPVELLP